MKIIKEAIKLFLITNGYKISKIKSPDWQIGFEFGKEASDVI